MKFYAEIDYQNRIVPINDSDQDALKKLKKNEPLRFEVVRERNYDFHKKFMALLNLGYQNQNDQNEIKSFDHYRKLMTMKAGHYETLITDKGTVYIANSISFAKMDQTEFESVFDGMLDVIAKQLDSKPEDIRNEVYNFA